MWYAVELERRGFGVEQKCIQRHKFDSIGFEPHLDAGHITRRAVSKLTPNK